MRLLLLISLLSLVLVPAYDWLSVEAAQYIIDQFEARELNRSAPVRGVDRRSSSPFISGDGFRAACPHICDDSNRCRFSPESVENGDCIFVKSDFFEFFARDVTSRIKGKYVIVTHNGDLSTPDGQDDAPRIGASNEFINPLGNGDPYDEMLLRHAQVRGE